MISKNTSKVCKSINIQKQCHSDVITELDGPILHKRCLKNVSPWKHEQSDFAQIWYKGTN